MGYDGTPAMSPSPGVSESRTPDKSNLRRFHDKKRSKKKAASKRLHEKELLNAHHRIVALRRSLLVNMNPRALQRPTRPGWTTLDSAGKTTYTLESLMAKDFRLIE